MNELNKKFWTEEFYDMAYDIVKDRKFPILIPSFNRPDPIVMKKMFSDMTDEYNYPIFIFVRESQRADYEKNLTNKFAKIISIPDEEINSAGKTRQGSLMWLYNNGYEKAFTIDDDIPKIGFSVKGVTGKGTLVSKDGPELLSAKVFAMWQLAMEVAIEKYDIVYSGIRVHSQAWQLPNTDEDKSMLYCSGLSAGVVCWNVKELVERGLKYEDNKISGFDDTDFVIKLVAGRNLVCSFPFLWYDMPSDIVSVQNFDFDTVEERFRTSTEIVKRNHGDKEFVRYKVDKRGIPGVGINWVRVRKMFGIDKFRYNIWKDIEDKIGGKYE